MTAASSESYGSLNPCCRWCGSGGIIAMGGAHRILIFVRRPLSFGRRAKSPTRRAQSSDSRAKSLTRRAPSSDSRAKSLTCRAPSSDGREKSLTRRAPSSDGRAKSLARRAQSSGRRERLSMCRVVKAASDHSDSSSKTAFWHCGAALQRPISRPRALDGTALPIDLRGVKCRRT